MSNQQLEPFISEGIYLDSSWTEQIILILVDEFNIRVAWDTNTALITGAFALVGGAIGGYTGGKICAAIGAGVGGATGFAAANIISLREVWDSVKENLKELFYIILNYLQRLDADDCARALDMLLVCIAHRRNLVITIVEFIANKLGREVFSSIATA